MKSSSDRTVAVLHLLVALALLQPRRPLPKSAGVRVAVQTSVWAAAGAAASSAASRPATAAAQAKATRRGRRGALGGGLGPGWLVTGVGAGGGGALVACHCKFTARTCCHAFFGVIHHVVSPCVPAWTGRAIRVHTVSIADRQPQVAPSPLRSGPLRAIIHI